MCPTPPPDKEALAIAGDGKAEQAHGGKMRRSLILWLTLAVTLPASRLWAYTVDGEGSSPVAFRTVWLDSPRVDKSATIRFSMAGQYAGEGVARLQLPSGIRLVQGDTLHHGRAMMCLRAN